MSETLMEIAEQYGAEQATQRAYTDGELEEFRASLMALKHKVVTYLPVNEDFTTARDTVRAKSRLLPVAGELIMGPYASNRGVTATHIAVYALLG